MMKKEMGGIATVCAAAICATAFGATSDVNLRDRVLGGNDFSYYRWSGAGETFVMTTATVTTNLSARARFWQRVKSATVPTIFQLTFPRTSPDWKQKLPKTADEAVAAIDAFFAPGEGVEPCPKAIYAVTPCEENVTWDGQTEVQDAIAKHLRGKYGVKTYQWLTEPMKPTLAFQADGWVFDAYCITDPNAFYAHVESFLLTGVPVVPCIWASGNFSNYHKNRTWDDLTRFTVERMDICRALDLPVMVFAVAGKSGSVGAWFSKVENPGERYYRETVKHYLAAVPTMPKASWRPAPKLWRANVKRDGTVRSKVDLRAFELVDETEFDDVRAWRLTDTGLNLVAPGGGRLAWRMRPQGHVRKGRFALRHSPGAKGSFCGKPLSPGGLTAVDAGEFDSKTLVLDAAAPLTLTELSFFGEGEGRVESIGVEMDTSYGRTDYRRQFAFDPEEAAQTGEKGHTARKRVMRKVVLPGCGGKLMVEAKAFAHKSYAGSVKMWLSLDGETPLAEVATKGDKPWHDLSLEHRLADGVDAVYLVFDVAVSCGVDTGSTVGAKVTTCDFKFRPEHP